MSEYTHIPRGFDPVFDERSRVLVLGSFPSVLSRQNAFYYGNPRNRFWKVAAACTGAAVPPDEPIDESIAAKKQLLLDAGIALWDVIESCDIRGSSDASIRNVVAADVQHVMAAAPIEAVLCNGATAGRLYRAHLQQSTGIAAEVMPSTSPANAAWSLERLTEVWRRALKPHLPML